MITNKDIKSKKPIASKLSQLCTAIAVVNKLEAQRNTISQLKAEKEELEHRLESYLNLGRLDLNEITRLLKLGFTRKEIAARFMVSYESVKKYIQRSSIAI